MQRRRAIVTPFAVRITRGFYIEDDALELSCACLLQLLQRLELVHEPIPLGIGDLGLVLLVVALVVVPDRGPELVDATGRIQLFDGLRRDHRRGVGRVVGGGAGLLRSRHGTETTDGV